MSIETAATAFWPVLALQRQFDESELSLEMRHDVIVAYSRIGVVTPYDTVRPNGIKMFIKEISKGIKGLNNTSHTNI